MPIVTAPPTTQYSLETSAHRFWQGGRDVYYFTLPLETLDGLLPQRVDDDVVRGANRQLTPSHARNIQAYLDEKDDWLLGAMMLGIARDAVDFAPYASEDDEPANPNFGKMGIRTNRINTMRIFDGQHRRRAIQEVLASLESDDRRASKLQTLRNASMTIILYAEDDIKALKQMFADASQTKRIEANTVARFDRRDAFNITAMRIAEESRVFKGRVEMEGTSVSHASENILAINQLVAISKALEVGNRGRVTRERNDEYMLDLDSLYERCSVWTDEFLPAARDEYRGLITGNIANSDIPQLRARTFAYNATFIRILAGCYRSWLLEFGHWQSLADFIGNAAITRGSKSGLLVDAGIVNPSNNTLLFSRRQEVQRAIDYVVAAAKASVGD